MLIEFVSVNTRPYVGGKYKDNFKKFNLSTFDAIVKDFCY